MFRKLFKSTPRTEILYDEYDKLIRKSHELATVSRILSDKKFSQAMEKLEEIKRLEAAM